MTNATNAISGSISVDGSGRVVRQGMRACTFALLAFFISTVTLSCSADPCGEPTAYENQCAPKGVLVAALTGDSGASPVVACPTLDQLSAARVTPTVVGLKGAQFTSGPLVDGERCCYTTIQRICV